MTIDPLAQLGASAPVTPADAGSLAHLPLNDIGNARRLIARFGRHLAWVGGIGWYGWTGSHWDAEAGEDLAVRAAHVVSEGLMAEAAALEAVPGKAKAADALRKFATESGNAGRTNAMLNQAKGYLARARDSWDPDPLVFNTPSGTLRLIKAGPDAYDRVMSPHNPEDRITRCLDAEYDPAARCPKWLQHLETVLPDPEVRDFLQVAVGYSFTGAVREQCLFVLQGRGRDGKSTTMGVLRRLAGAYGGVCDVKTFLDSPVARDGAAASPDLARLQGEMRLVSTAEPPRGARLDEAKVKAVTGGAPMLARHLSRDPFQFMPRFKLWIECNARPRISGDDDGIWRRFHLILFPNQFPEGAVVKGYEEELFEERSGILNWVLDGVEMWLRDGLVRPEATVEVMEDYRRSANPFGEWFAECVVRDEAALTPAAEFRASYESWCSDNGHEPISARAFGDALADRQVIRAKKDRSGKVIRRGARLVRAASAAGQVFSDDEF